ncbi:MAG: CPBP family intramembrane metalloprotease [Cyanobacteria bacterium RU_5_0]|nr:CPBP family intramembrane metalloprotease [Cyanobacteria bacterium RU_5_0]
MSTSLWILLFFLAWLSAWLPIAIPLAIALKWHPPQPITLSQKLPLIATLYLLAPLVLWGVAFLREETFVEYGLVWNLSEWGSLGLGFVAGVLGLLLMFGIEWALGWLRWRSWLIGSSLPTLFLGLWISFTEELVFRGFLLNQLQYDYAPWIAATIASLIFALLHLIWEGRENISQLPGLWLMGMVLSLARWVDDGNLGLACGLHAGWIWTIATLDTAQAITYTDRVSQWFTGLGGKPLAGLVGLIFLLATGGILWAIRHGIYREASILPGSFMIFLM